jgi:hypothetical protein
MIGLYSASGPNWANMGRSLVRGILNSARGLSDKDNSPEAQKARRISGFADLDGIEFVARIDIGKDSNGEDKNDIRQAVTRDHKEYAAAYAPPQPSYAAPAQQSAYVAPQPQQSGYVAPQAQQPSYAPQAPQQAAPAPAAGVRPTWAK